MKRLIKKKPNGDWQLDGVSWDDLRVGGIITKDMFDRLYSALWKLKEYGDSGLQPDAVAEILWT